MTLSECRMQIDDIDRELVHLFSKRMAIAAEIAACKQAQGMPVTDAAREAIVIQNAQASAPEALRPYIPQLYQTIMYLSRAYQQQLCEKGH